MDFNTSFNELIQQAQAKISSLMQAKAQKIQIRAQLDHTLQRILQQKSEYRGQTAYISDEIDRLAEHNATIDKDIRRLQAQTEESKQQLGLISSLAAGEKLKLTTDIEAVGLRISQHRSKADAEDIEDATLIRRMRAERKDLQDKAAMLEDVEEQLKEKLYQLKQGGTSRSNQVGMKYRELDALFDQSRVSDKGPFSSLL